MKRRVAKAWMVVGNPRGMVQDPNFSNGRESLPPEAQKAKKKERLLEQIEGSIMKRAP